MKRRAFIYTLPDGTPITITGPAMIPEAEWSDVIDWMHLVERALRPRSEEPPLIAARPGLGIIKCPNCGDIHGVPACDPPEPEQVSAPEPPEPIDATDQALLKAMAPAPPAYDHHHEVPALRAEFTNGETPLADIDDTPF